MELFADVFLNKIVFLWGTVSSESGVLVASAKRVAFCWQSVGVM